MRKLFMAIAAVAALGLAVPLSTPAEAQGSTVVVKQRDGDRSVRTKRKVTIIKRDRRPRYYSEGRRSKVVIVKKKRTPRAAISIRTN